MDILERVFLAAYAAEDKKASDPVLLDVSELTSYTDCVLIVSGTSDRRVRSIAEAVRDAVKEAGAPVLGVEGLRDGRWVLVDCGAFVVHVFYEELRPVFDLEGLWSDARRVAIPPRPKEGAAQAAAGGKGDA